MCGCAKPNAAHQTVCVCVCCSSSLNLAVVHKAGRYIHRRMHKYMLVAMQHHVRSLCCMCAHSSIHSRVRDHRTSRKLVRTFKEECFAASVSRVSGECLALTHRHTHSHTHSHTHICKLGIGARRQSSAVARL